MEYCKICYPTNEAIPFHQVGLLACGVVLGQPLNSKEKTDGTPSD